MTKEPTFCPVCYTDVTKVKKRDKISKKCPKCSVILNCNPRSMLIRCAKCNRLFSDVLTYKEHLSRNGDCNYVRPMLVLI